MTDTMPREERLSAETSGGGRRVIAELADELLPVLIARLASSALGELEVRENGWRVRLRRPVAANGSQTSAPARQSKSGETPRAAVGQQAAPGAGDGRGSGRTERGRSEVVSPAVGYFVPRDGVAIGSTLRAGDVVGQIDVLGVRQDVLAAHDGILARFEVEPGQAVEYGQPIARLEPRG